MWRLKAQQSSWDWIDYFDKNWHDFLLKKLAKNANSIQFKYLWIFQGKSFMHMYLCSFVERRGNEDVHMAINDRRNTPFVKRAILACTIQWNLISAILINRTAQFIEPITTYSSVICHWQSTHTNMFSQ